MKERVPDAASERDLDQLRSEASAGGPISREGIRPAGAPFPRPSAETGYYGLPALKEPTWTWEVPIYFFVGGAAGACAALSAAARWTGADARLVRRARWIAAAGAALSPPLLISDLGRPERFLNMLRVAKIRSPMSVGAWTLVAFSTSASAAAFADLLDRRLGGSVPVRVVADAAGALSAVTGLGMATYTGVLLGATAIPAWYENASVLPAHFAASALGSAVGLLELSGRSDPALNALGLAAAAAEIVVGASLESRRGRSLEPLKTGRAGAFIRAGGLLSGPIAFLLRSFGGRNIAMRRVAGVAAVTGSMCTRIGWVAAGHASARDPIPVLNAGSDAAVSREPHSEPPG
ncbi:MAG: NrfD/PsrC family molybdoenzyme membrane anchor subunit [Acidobacteriota bacterium]